MTFIHLTLFFLSCYFTLLLLDRCFAPTMETEWIQQSGVWAACYSDEYFPVYAYTKAQAIDAAIRRRQREDSYQ